MTEDFESHYGINPHQNLHCVCKSWSSAGQATLNDPLATTTLFEILTPCLLVNDLRNVAIFPTDVCRSSR